MERTISANSTQLGAGRFLGRRDFRPCDPYLAAALPYSMSKPFPALYPPQRQRSSAHPFTSPFSFDSAAENGPFFFWFRCLLPSCGGVVWNSQIGQAAALMAPLPSPDPVLACFPAPLVSV